MLCAADFRGDGDLALACNFADFAKQLVNLLEFPAGGCDLFFCWGARGHGDGFFRFGCHGSVGGVISVEFGGLDNGPIWHDIDFCTGGFDGDVGLAAARLFSCEDRAYGIVLNGDGCDGAGFQVEVLEGVQDEVLVFHQFHGIVEC